MFIAYTQATEIAKYWVRKTCYEKTPRYELQYIYIYIYSLYYFHFRYKTGQIIVLLLQKEKQEIVNVLKGHNDEVHCLAWSPVPASELPGGE